MNEIFDLEAAAAENAQRFIKSIEQLVNIARGRSEESCGVVEFKQDGEADGVIIALDLSTLDLPTRLTADALVALLADESKR